jgi:hypothetical protein
MTKLFGLLFFYAEKLVLSVIYLFKLKYNQLKLNENECVKFAEFCLTRANQYAYFLDELIYKSFVKFVLNSAKYVVFNFISHIKSHPEELQKILNSHLISKLIGELIVSSEHTQFKQTQFKQTKSDQTKFKQTKFEQTKSDQTKFEQTKSDQTQSIDTYQLIDVLKSNVKLINYVKGMNQTYNLDDCNLNKLLQNCEQKNSLLLLKCKKQKQNYKQNCKQNKQLNEMLSIIKNDIQNDTQLTDTQLTEQSIETQLTEQSIETQLTEQLTEQVIDTQLTEQAIETQLTEQAIETQLTEQSIETQLTDTQSTERSNSDEYQLIDQTTD